MAGRRSRPLAVPRAVVDTAAALDAYALPERGAWLAFRDRRNLRVFVEDDQRLSR